MIEPDLAQNHRAKILYLTSSPHLAGAERCLLNIVCHLDQAQFSPLVLVPAEGSLACELRKNRIDVRVFNLAVLENKRELYSPRILSKLVAIWVCSIKLARLIRSEKVSIVHSNTSGVLAGAVAAIVAGVPHIWHVREILVSPRRLWLLMRLLIPLMSSRVICVSTAVAAHFLASSKNQKKMVVVHDSIDEEAFVTGSDPSFCLHDAVLDSALWVGMVARVNLWKGHLVFIQAAHMVARAIPTARFHIAGGCLAAYQDVQSAMARLVTESGLEGKVILWGDLDLKQVAALMSQLDILVVPSTSPEPFGLTMLEAMAFSKPVIASDAGGPRDVVIPEVTGLLVPPGDADALAQAILRLIDNPELRLSMGEAGRQRLRDHFGLGAQMLMLEAIYKDVLHQKPVGICPMEAGKG